MTRISLWTLLLTTLLGLVACQTDEGEFDCRALNAYFDDEVQQQNIPAMGVVVFQESQNMHSYYTGRSDVENDVALTENHAFLLASASKMVTGVAGLRLYDAGLLDLDDPINDHLPFTVQTPGFTTPITVRMLLTHTSGIADNGTVLDDQYYDNQDSPIALATFMQDYFTPTGQYYDAVENFHNFEPGTDHEYSNTGSALLGVIVEHVSGQSFNGYCNSNIFTPLGMNNTAWRLDELGTTTLVQPYEYEQGDWTRFDHYTFTDYPNGGLRSTPEDLYRFLRAFVQEGKSGDYQLLEAATVQAMMTPQIPNLEPTMGLHCFEYEGGLWGHDGSEKGVSTIMVVDPTSKVGAIVLTNESEAEVEPIAVEAIEYGKEQAEE